MKNAIYYTRIANLDEYKPCSFCRKKAWSKFECGKLVMVLCDRCLHAKGLHILEFGNSTKEQVMEL